MRTVYSGDVPAAELKSPVSTTGTPAWNPRTRRRISSALFTLDSADPLSRCVLTWWKTTPVRRSRNLAQVTIRTYRFPQLAEPMASGVSDSQKWSKSSTSNRLP